MRKSKSNSNHHDAALRRAIGRPRRTRHGRPRGPLPAPLAMLAFLALGALGAGSALPGCSQEGTASRGPYLSISRDPRTTMTITWETRSPTAMTLRYGTAAEGLGRELPVPAPARRRDDRYYHYTVTLTGLEPGARYVYQVVPLQATPASFKTAPEEPAGAFQFLLYGDSRSRVGRPESKHCRLVDAMVRDQDLDALAFVINTGDIVQTHNSVSSWDRHFEAISPLASRAPYLVAGGNHDWRPDAPDEAAQTLNLVHELPTEDRADEAVSGLGETSYAFGYSCAYVIVLGMPHTGQVGDTAVNRWLEEQLAIAEDGYRFTFVAFHRPAFDRRGDVYEDAVDVLEHQAPLMHLGGVDAVVNGHDHVLAVQQIRYAPDTKDVATARPVTYVISGGGGAELREAYPGSWSSRHGLGFHGETLHAASLLHYYVVSVDCDAGRAVLTPFDLGGEQPHPPVLLEAHR